MKSISLFLSAFMFSYCALAQHTVPLKNLWADPEVHVLFEGYTVSFTVKDINRALVLLAETGDTTFGLNSHLETGKNYAIELQRGTRMEYHTALQPLIQNGVGVFLLTAGHAYIENSRHRKVKEMTMEIQPMAEGTNDVYIFFYDPRTNKMVFSGKMAVDMYKKDLGIE